jgi:spectrin alpha
MRYSYTEHSTVGLAQAWDQLDQLAMRMQHNLEQLIQARNQSGVSEEALREFSMMFKHFDRDKVGRLDHQQFKSCLRALGYDLPMVEEGQPEPEFNRILDIVDPNRYARAYFILYHLIFPATVMSLYKSTWLS